MSKTLLDGVNEILKRVNIIAGDTAALTTLTDSSKQHWIDTTIQVINEGVDELFTATSVELPKSQASSTIVLVNGTREYTLASDMVQLRWPMIDRVNTQYIWQFSGGYEGMLELDPEQDDTGLPQWGAISPITGLLHLDRTPTTVEAGKTYTYQYDKDTVLTGATSVFPFSDTCFRAMVPAWVQLWKRESRAEFDKVLYDASIGRASRVVTELEPRSHYSPR
jgi:hypothetical protein